MPDRFGCACRFANQQKRRRLADVYDITVTVTCQGQGPIEGVTAGSVGQLGARLSCVAQSQRSSEAQSFSPYAASGCRMGRLEVYNPSARHADGNGQGTWGTVCGHWCAATPGRPVCALHF